MIEKTSTEKAKELMDKIKGETNKNNAGYIGNKMYSNMTSNPAPLRDIQQIEFMIRGSK